MAKISLRAYHREIEGLIEHGRTKDAVAHCRYILKYLPKSIDTFRLLGKAYLEGQRYTEGADVLQRVLSAVPDDFVSQVGMSIIREDEGNLDAAIWHMERAFEAQPSNLAVQDELRRLYGRRDGVQPAKIRLTRGALVRMYARGDLYQQAIAEARMALVEQPDRVDLEMILARMYFLSGQKVSATDVCTRLLDKLPFCYEANKILTETLPGTPREDEVKTYQQRLNELDPYLPYLPDSSSTSTEAPENAVMLEYPEEPGEGLEESGQLPTWAQNLGVKWEESQEDEKLPEWMTSVNTATPEAIAAEGQPEEQTLSEPLSEKLEEPVGEEIPEWMKKAGWQSSAGEETPSEISEEAIEELSKEAEIPDWLQSLAPVEEPEMEAAATDNEENTRWLESILAGEETDVEEMRAGSDAFQIFEEEPKPEEKTGMGEEFLPSDEGVGFGGEAIPVEEIPFVEESIPSEVFPSTTEPEETLIENVSEEVNAFNQNEPIPDWLAGLAEIEDEGSSEELVEEVSEDTGWLKDLTDKTGTPEEPTAEIKEDTTWLKDLLSKETKQDEAFMTEGEVQEIEKVEEVEEPAGFEPLPFDEEQPVFNEQPIIPSDQQEGLISEVGPFEGLEPEINPFENIDLEVPEEPVEPVEVPILSSTDDFLAEIEKSMSPDQDATQPTRLSQPVVEAQHEVLPPIEEELPEDVAEFFKGSLEEPIEIDSDVPEMLQGILDMDEGIASDEIERSASILEENLPLAVDGTPISEIEDLNLPDWLKDSLDMDLGENEIAGTEEPTSFSVDLSATQEFPESPLLDEAFDELAVSQNEPPADMDAESAISWLEEVAAKNEAAAEDLTAIEEESAVEILGEPEELPLPGEEIPFAGDEGIIPGSEEVTPEFLTSGEIYQEKVSEEIEAPSVNPEEEAPTEETVKKLVLPDWLAEDLTEEEDTAPVISDSEAFEPPSLEELEWIKEESLFESKEEPHEMPEVEQVEGQAPDIRESFAEEGTEEAEEEFAGLDDTYEVAAKSAEIDQSGAALAEAPISDESSEQAEEVPDWLMALAEDTELGESRGEVSEELPTEWLKDLEAEELTTAEEVVSEPEVEQPTPTPEPISLQEVQQEETSIEDTSPIRIITSPASDYATEGSDLYNAQAALNSHEIEKALTYYNKLISRDEAIDESIHDLRDALDRFPVDTLLWQTLGDAYARNNQLQEALDAYTKAEELLR